MTDAVQEPTSIADLEKVMRELDGGTAPANPGTEVKNGMPVGNPLTLKEFVNVEQLKRDVQFNPNNLDEDVSQHASKFVYYADQERLARRQLDGVKAAFEILEARLDNLHRTALKEGGKATEGQIAAAVKSDPRWWAGNKRMIDAKAIYDLTHAATEAFSHRRDMIIQVSVDRRKEREGELRVLSAQAGQQNTFDARSRALEAAAGAHQSAREAMKAA